MIVVDLAVAALVVVVLSTIVVSLVRSPYTVDEDAVTRALAAAGDSAVARILITSSKRLSRLPAVHQVHETALHRSIQARLAAAGGAYGGSVDVFLSTQIGAAMAAGGLLAIVVVTHPAWYVMAVAMAFAVGFVLYPYDAVRSRAKDRAERVSDDLPDFCDMLLIPLTLGKGVLESLRFVAERSQGPVAEEITALVTLLEAQAAPDERQAFITCGQRLGTPEAANFLNSLMMAHLEATSVSTTIAAQSNALRVGQFQRARARAKKIPVRMVVLFTVNLMPLLFVVILIPVGIGFAHAFGGH